MDMSKLPRLSQTNKDDAPTPIPGGAPPPPMPSPDRNVPDYQPRDRVGAAYAPGIGAEVWISIAVGVILLLMSSRFWQYVFNRANFTWTFSDPQGNPLTYPQTVFFWGDLAMVAFGFVLVAEGIVLALARRPMVIAAALVFTVLATMLNLAYLIVMMQRGYGLQLISAFAVAFGVYIAMSQWSLLGALRRSAGDGRA